MTPRTAQGMLRNFMMKSASTGGALPQSRQILIQLKACGTHGVVKPSNKQELVDGILSFWETVDEHKCHKYINHLKRVIPKVIEYQGNATGY